jgi:hypothetical protein
MWLRDRLLKSVVQLKCVISNDAERRRPLQEFFPLLITKFRHTSASAHELCLLSSSLFICVTLTCSAVCVHQLGIAHQSSLRSPPPLLLWCPGSPLRAGERASHIILSASCGPSTVSVNTETGLLAPLRGRRRYDINQASLT